MPVATGERAPEFDLEEAYDKPRLRLEDFRGKRNVLLVFHPFAFTEVCREEALDLQANLASFNNAETDVIFVSCDTSAARQAWKREFRGDLRLRLRLLAARRGRTRVRGLQRGDWRPVRGTFLIDKEGVVIWSLVKDGRRTEMVPESLEALDQRA